MQKILFIHSKMGMGGLERVMINLMKATTDFEIHLGLLDIDNGELIKEVPKNVTIIKMPIDKRFYYQLDSTISNKQVFKIALKKGRFIKAFSIFIKKIFNTSMPKSSSWKKIENFPNEYDIVVCYDFKQTPLMKYCATKVNAKVKVAWMHDNLEETKYNPNHFYKLAKDFRYVFANGRHVHNINANILKKHSSKIKIMYNIIDFDNMKMLASSIDNLSSIFLETQDTKIISIGALSYGKGYDIALDVAKRLKEDKCKFRWFIIGDGDKKEEIRQKIIEYNLENYFFLLSNQLNPYSYLANSDIFVHCSRHESYCTVINEARFFCVPTVTTLVGGVDEMIVDGTTGLIAKTEAEDIYRKVKFLFEENRREEMRANQKSILFENIDANKLWHDIYEGEL
ncbi:MAG: glycosyltransferase [Defluviitaleaceae bacterium]|nr:glycosyltransferase [Defluviitaleaceae bacterium]